jgi:hypothetical protein
MKRLALKNIKHSEFNSQETNCFKSDIYFDNKKVAYCHNDGRGGSTHFSYYPGQEELFKEMEEYCHSLPSAEYGDTPLEMDLELVVGDILEEWLMNQEKNKFLKKLEKNFDRGICYGKKEDYTVMFFEGGGKRVTIKEMCKSEAGRNCIAKACEKLVKDGHTILNTNI